jgi:hypothetical protein
VVAGLLAAVAIVQLGRAAYRPSDPWDIRRPVTVTGTLDDITIG